MMMRYVLIIAAATLAAAAHAADGETNAPAPRQRAVSFDIATGLQYDSNVAVLELDTATNVGDSAALLELGLAYRSPGEGRAAFTAGYNLSQTAYEDFDAFDLTIHRGSAGFSYDLGRTDVGASVNHAEAKLDGTSFLTFTQLSPYFSRLVGERLFLRFAYLQTDKDFARNPTRDARTRSLTADAYVFVNGLASYFVLGLRHDDEDAIDAQLDYGGRRLNAQYIRRLALAERELTLRAELRSESRDYSQPTLLIGAPRRDDRRQLDLSADWPITTRMSMRLAYRYANNRSNLELIDFDERVYSATLRARF